MRKNILNRKGENSIMKSAMFKKLASGLIALLLVSIMMPVMASAAVWIKDVVYHADGTVTGTVYSDEKHGRTVNIEVYGVTGDVYLQRVTSNVYEPKNDLFYYDFESSVIDSTYNPIYVKALGTVSEAVYRNKRSNSGGGGFYYVPGLADSNGNISSSALISAFADKSAVEVEISGDVATIPASAIAEIAKKNPNAVLVIKNATGSYSLPLSAIDYEALAKQLGVDLANLNIKVQIKALTGAAAQAVADAIKTLGGKSAAPVVDFTVTAEGNGKSVAVKDFGNTYVARTINANADFAATVTGVVYNANSGALTFVPSTAAGKVATLKSTSNSIYTVVEFNKSFSDVTGKWSEKYVESMANKLVVNGYETGLFQPNKAITRAEFAALVVRALGLSNKSATANFSDVAATAWYANDVAVAAQAGIVKGDGNNTFRPSDVISRKELAAMVVRASEYAGTKLAADASALAQFKDASNLGWAQAEVSAAVKAGIVNGLGNNVLGANSTATRAEAATMLQRFLVNAKFINE